MLLELPTGSGKTVIFCELLKAVSAKGNRAIMVVRGKSLVHQCSDRLHRESVEHGVYQGSHWNRNRSANIQICSIDTLFRRKEVPKADLVVIDESHFASSESFLWLAEQYPNAFFLPVTATPYPTKSIAHVAETVVKPITMRELIDLGFLVDARYFAPSRIDVSDVAIDAKTKDYKTAPLFDAVSKPKIVGDILGHYRRICYDQAAVCFAVNKRHSLMLSDAFNQAGIAAAHVEDSTTDTQRKEILRRHEAGEIKVICNVGILCTGVDMPWLRAVIMARPTRSLILFVQQAGRGTRTYPGKENFILLDHAGNIERHGFITDDHPANLDGKPRRDELPEVNICSVCYCTFSGDECPECGETEKIEVIRAQTEHVEGTLVEIKPTNSFGSRAVESQIKRWIQKAVDRGYNPYWVKHQIEKKYPGETFLFTEAWKIMPDGLTARRFITKNSTLRPT